MKHVARIENLRRRAQTAFGPGAWRQLASAAGYSYGYVRNLLSYYQSSMTAMDRLETTIEAKEAWNQAHAGRRISVPPP